MSTGATGGYFHGIYPAADSPVMSFKVEGDDEARVKITPSGVYQGDGTASPVPAVGQFVRLTSDQVLADATLADTLLTFNVLASGVYRFDANLVVITPEADDIKVNVTGPTSATADIWIGGLAAAASAATGDSDFTSVPINTNATRGSEDTARIVVPFRGIVVVSTTAGAVTIQAAKGADAGADGNVKAGSWIHAVKVA